MTCCIVVATSREGHGIVNDLYVSKYLVHTQYAALTLFLMLFLQQT